MSLLEVSKLTKNFGGNRAVDNVSFNLQAGELLALIGPNGAGKTTTFNMVGGQLAASGGSVMFDGKELLGMPTRKIAHAGVGRTFQIASGFGSLTVLENVQMAFLSHFAQVYSFWRSASRRYVNEAKALLEQVGMLDQAERPCSELAYGDVKRVELAMSLAGNPRLLLMDEPTAGMAPTERKALVKLVKDIVVQRSMAVLFTEHSMDVVFAYADRVIVLARGRLIAQGSVQEVRNDPEVQAVYFGAGKTFQSAQTGKPA